MSPGPPHLFAVDAGTDTSAGLFPGAELSSLEEVWLSCSLGNTWCIQMPIERIGSLGTTMVNDQDIGRLLAQHVSGPWQRSPEYQGTCFSFENGLSPQEK